MVGLLLDITIPKVSFPWEILPPESSTSINVYQVNDIKGNTKSFTSMSGLYPDPVIRGRKNQESRYFTFTEEKPSDGIEDLSQTINKNTSNIKIYKHDGSYSLNLQFYGRKPKYFGIKDLEYVSYYYKYNGIFEEDEKAAEEPYIENYNTLTLEGLFILLIKLVDRFKISGDVLFQDFYNEHFEALAGTKLPRTIINYILSKSSVHNNNNFSSGSH